LRELRRRPCLAKLVRLEIRKLCRRKGQSLRPILCRGWWSLGRVLGGHLMGDFVMPCHHAGQIVSQQLTLFHHKLAINHG
jgi:hypothetical protein